MKSKSLLFTLIYSLFLSVTTMFSQQVQKIGKDSLQENIELMTLLIKNNPNDAEAYLFRGVAKASQGNYFEAITDYNQAIRINPQYELAYHNRALTKFKLEDYRGTIIDINKAIELNPYNGHSYYLRGLSNLNLGNNDAGCLDFSKAGELGYSYAYKAIQAMCNK